MMSRPARGSRRRGSAAGELREALLLEVGIEAQILADAQPSHDREADAVDEAELASSCCQQRGETRIAILRRDRIDLDERQNSLTSVRTASRPHRR